MYIFLCLVRKMAGFTDVAYIFYECVRKSGVYTDVFIFICISPKIAKFARF